MLGSGFNCHENRFFFLGWKRGRKGWNQGLASIPHMSKVKVRLVLVDLNLFKIEHQLSSWH